MGGVAGHMSHLYDNPSLSFNKIKEILAAISNAELEAEEKVDGQNIFLSYSVNEGKAKAARNKGNLVAGGLDAHELATKFADRGSLTEAFTEGFSTFEKAVDSLDNITKRRIFGPDTNIWYNAEIMDPRSANVILYDSRVLKIHDLGHFEVDKKTGKKLGTDVSKNLEILDHSLNRMQSALGREDFSLLRKAVIELQKLEDGKALTRALGRIDAVLRSEGLSEDNTIEEYVFHRVFNGIDTDLPKTRRLEITNYLLKTEKNIGLRLLKRGLSEEDKSDLSSIVNSKRMILQGAIAPVEEIIHDFAVEILKGMESAFIIDNRKETERLQKELSFAVDEITKTGHENPDAMEIMQAHLNKIKDMSNISTPVEGIVFQYDGDTYKFTGNFAPINQILGLFKYGRGTKALHKEVRQRSTESILTEEEGNIKKEPSKAKQFVLSLPKFTPTETWGDPESMERSQINKIFGAIGGGADVKKKINNILGTIRNPENEKGFSSPQRIISTLIVLESLTAVINSFSSSAAGFVFEGFMAALLGGRQVADPKDGSLPIQDLIAFTEYGGSSGVPISLKLLKEPGPVKGSYTNLIKGINEFGLVVYIVARKTGHSIKLEQFNFSKENLVNLFAAGLTSAGFSTLFALPDEKRPGKWLSSEQSLAKLQNASNWEEQFNMLQHSAGFSTEQRVSDSDDEVDIIDTEDDQARDKAEDEKLRQSTNDRIFSVEENRKLWTEDKNLILEAAGKGGKQWHLSVAALKKSKVESGWETLGELPANPEATERVAEQYMGLLQENLTAIFEATSQLSENVGNYFTYPDRSQATNAGKDAINDAKTVSSEMSKQVSQDSAAPGQRNENTEFDFDVITEDKGKRVALFPGKFKPPHRGHYEFAENLAKRDDVDEVVVLISSRDKPEVSNEQSLAIWKSYLNSSSAPSNIRVEMSNYPSPITEVYEFAADPEKVGKNDTVYVVKSTKDDAPAGSTSKGDQRFDGIKAYADKHNPGVNVEQIAEKEVTRDDGEPYHAGDARKPIANKDLDSFAEFLPLHANPEEVWSILKPSMDLDRQIDDTIDEMSGMGAGAVGGYGAPLGISTSSKKKRSTKPKVIRGKRQRRR